MTALVASSAASQTHEAPNFPNGNGDGRGPDGRFVPGNQVARQAGIYARQQPADLRERVNELTAGILSDLGGVDELSTLERAYVGRLAEVEVTLRLLAHDIAERGLLTPSGGVRRVYDQLLAGLDRWDKLAQRIGTKRRARPVQSATEIMREYDAEREAQR
jgi:hypothetical protein